MRFALVLLCLAGCVTQYPMGVRETRVAPNMWRISSSGSAYTSSEQTIEMGLLRAAELVLGAGYRFFVVTNVHDQSNTETYTTPIRATTKTSGNRTRTVVSGGQTYDYTMPGVGGTVVAFAERPETSEMVYDAAFLVESMGPRYGLQKPAYSSTP